jgi:hypothetical protein
MANNMFSDALRLAQSIKTEMVFDRWYIVFLPTRAVNNSDMNVKLRAMQW